MLLLTKKIEGYEAVIIFKNETHSNYFWLFVIHRYGLVVHDTLWQSMKYKLLLSRLDPTRK